MRFRSTIAAASAAAALVFAVAAPQAQGMAMYDSSTYYEGGAAVTFVCGFECGWLEEVMPYHEEISYPDKGGSFELIGDGCIMSSGHPNLQDHGYAELSGADLNSSTDDVHWNMWGDGGTEVGGSPFEVVCSPEPPGRRQLSFTRRLKVASGITREFRALDTNRDGTLSTGELRAGAMRDFRQMDLNHDGVVDARDVRIDLQRQPGTHRHPGVKARFPFDLDHNGRVSPSEYWRYVRRTFVQPMSHGKGKITLAEAEAFYSTH